MKDLPDSTLNEPIWTMGFEQLFFLSFQVFNKRSSNSELWKCVLFAFTQPDLYSWNERKNVYL